MVEGDGAEGTSAQGAEAGAAAANADKGASETDAKLKQAREEAITERKARQDLEAKVKKLEDAQLSADERRTARLAELEAEHLTKDAKIQELRTDNAIAFAAVEAQARYPKEVAKLISASDVKYDADGAPTNIEALVAAVKKRMPELFLNAGSADGGPRGTATGPSQSMNDLLRQKAGRGA